MLTHIAALLALAGVVLEVPKRTVSDASLSNAVPCLQGPV
jgi:hypothetical protein